MNIFTEITSAESLYLFLWLLGAFIIGLIVGWYIWGVAKRTLEAELADWKAKYQTLKEDNEKLNSALETAKANYAELENDYDWKAQRLHDIETEKGDLHTEIYSLKDKLKASEATKLAYGNQIQGLNASYNGAKAEISALDSKIKTLETALKDAERIQNNQNRNIKDLETQLEETIVSYSSTNDASAALEADLETANETIANLHTKITDLQNNISEYKAMVVNLQSAGDDGKAANARIAVLEGKIIGLNEQLDITKEALADCHAAKAELQAAVIMSSPDDESEISVEDAKVAVAKALNTYIGTASPDEKNDLTKIKGIGEFIESKLNELGIYTFRQIANFDDAVVSNVTHAIEFFPGRIQRDEWIPQALGLVGENQPVLGSEIIEVEGAPVSKISPDEARQKVREILSNQFPVASAEDKDDLKVISGVGPFIEEKLNNLGIYTYEQVSLFDKKMVNMITDAIEFFPGRIERDNWVKQAKALYDAKSNK